MRWCAFGFVLFFGSSFLDQSDGAKILGVFAFPGPSQYIFGSALLKALAERGHEITSITVFPQKKPLKNFRDILIPENAKLTDDFMDDSYSDKEMSFFDELNYVYILGRNISVNVLENSEVKKLLTSPKEKFDLVITEVFLTETLYGLGQHFNAPLVGVSTMGTFSFIDRLVGNTSPISYVPHMGHSLPSEMTFYERFTNLMVNIVDFINYNYVQLPQQKKIYEKYFPNAKMTLDEVLRNFSLVLINDHFSLNFPRPYITNMIEVAGMQIQQQPDPLPHELQNFLDDAPEGVIYFSMGSNLKSRDFPPEKIQIFLNVFRSLKQKVMWKFEDPELPNKPQNVFISPWYPQPSVLAHPNVKVFISHGGLLSTVEAVFHAKPVLGLPMFGDQPMNVKNAVRKGFALSVDFRNLTEPELRHALNELINNRKYDQRAKEISQLYRDQPMTPMETAVYWVEYVLRHKGASHLRNAGQNLNFWQYHSLDTIFTLLGGMAFSILLVWKLLAFMRFLCSNILADKTKIKNN